eukprot:CAMPEP_0174374162 /NCGR_PEP_ID=MMETSP0811_2-20130205/109867_1 /TAXON_ID=73025 ORGANISM="Eutreptiella gymnastica-like, Strain CCMP1594" /NCGR_SAMPLE_ID=MMETSP0811_2 /ASSEMBLY_ACC=CAM_ASM_000667 /LENGTH=93 /DNA_ID=CAMNT_0015523227 /DNA_START=336 /DNA_END=612 /DNA_ORIENTATION=+
MSSGRPPQSQPPHCNRWSRGRVAPPRPALLSDARGPPVWAHASPPERVQEGCPEPWGRGCDMQDTVHEAAVEAMRSRMSADRGCAGALAAVWR